MKRTAEIVLTSIGLVFNVFGMIGFIILTSLINTEFFQTGFEEGFNEGLEEEGMEGALEASSFLNAIAGLGWFLVVVTFIGVITGILALVFFKGNKRPKAASIILIVSGAILLIGTLATGFIPAILFIIAGIMGLVKKPPKAEHLENEEMYTEMK